MPGKTRWLSWLFVVVVVAAAGLAASADSGTESEFLSLINSTRANSGLPNLQVDGGLQAHARAHTADMIAAGDIYHSSSAELSAAAGSGWSRVGENVGRGQSPSSLHGAFMDSPGHRENVLGDYNFVGISTDSAGDYLYVTVVFMKKGESAPPPPEAPPTTEAPPPSPEASATTLPPQPEPTTPVPVATTTSTTTTSLLPTTTTTTMDFPPDRPVVPGMSCLEATRHSMLCHN